MAQPQRANILDRVDQATALRIIIVSVLIFFGFAVVWYRSIYTDPERVFRSMLSNSLKTGGVTRHTLQEANESGQKIDQHMQLQNESNKTVQSQTVLTQTGTGAAVVTTESLGTPTDDYVRYRSIDTQEKKADGQPIDFSTILGVWGTSKTEVSTPLTDGELYNEAVLGIVPFGVVNAEQRRELLQLIEDKQVYKIDYSKVEKVTENGRPRYIYDVAVDPAAYIDLIKKFGEFTGLNHLGNLSASQYADSERLGFRLTIDVWSQHLSKIAYGSGERDEILSGHNAHKPVQIPSDAIGIDELQLRLQSLQ